MGLYTVYETLQRDVLEVYVREILSRHENLSLNWNGRIREHPYNKVRAKFFDLIGYCRGNVAGGTIDRHKQASCLCGAVFLSNIIVNTSGKKHNANEILSMSMGLNLLKMYMIKDKFGIWGDAEKKKICIEGFSFTLPGIDQNTHDKKDYRENISITMRKSHHCIYDRKKICEKFDVWAYSKIFFHLDNYNIERFAKFCADNEI